MKVYRRHKEFNTRSCWLTKALQSGWDIPMALKTSYSSCFVDLNQWPYFITLALLIHRIVVLFYISCWITVLPTSPSFLCKQDRVFILNSHLALEAWTQNLCHVPHTNVLPNKKGEESYSFFFFFRLPRFISL